MGVTGPAIPPRLQAEDYHGLLQRLLPGGSAWRPDGTRVDAFLTAVSKELGRLDSRAHDLIDEADPRTMSELLGAFLAFLELCEPGETEAEQQKALHAWLGLHADDEEAPTIEFLERACARLGFEVSITRAKMTRVGPARCGDRLTDEGFAFTLFVDTEEHPPHYARVGAARCGDRLATYGHAALACLLNQITHAHMVIHYRFSEA